ncbi:MAG TPA: phosphoribosylamine--glycine ligase [Candidatus Hydrogenedentes bacterium]|nr:phosphoribosylamine--glycine ligase [Candidatus Hydrogenedentota bacterium]HIJ72969.1 phosphoribosylamine--glycine ligase [Candidatus Hydrogenedentota bacterium]
MNVLLVGSGGREHALAWKIAQSPLLDKLYCAPGNPGMAALAECADIAATEFHKLIAFAKDRAVELTVVGPEDPLAKGIADCFAEAGLVVFGPKAAAAQLEASKAFAKQMMVRYGIPTGAYEEFTDADAAMAYVRAKGAPIVIKADGLAAGKGVTVAHDVDTALDAIRVAMLDKAFGDAGGKVVVEECLIGEEASILAFTDGATVLPMAPSQDHKPIFDGDRGPNTGGMGAYSPAPVVTPEMFEEVQRTILQPCVDGMAKEGKPYAGVLYAGLMITESGPQVIEFNCRFGDPETQVVLPRMKSDILPVMMACCNGTLDQVEIEWDDRACVTVVMASGGYPREYEKGKPITGIEAAEQDADVTVFHAGTRLDGSALLTNGGRVLGVTALGPDIESTVEKAYAAVEKIHFECAHYRTDIGLKALNRLA